MSLSPQLYSNSLERNGTLQDNTAQTSAYVQYEPHLLFSRYGWAPPLGPRADSNSGGFSVSPNPNPGGGSAFSPSVPLVWNLLFQASSFLPRYRALLGPGIGAGLRGCGCGRKVCATSCLVSVFSMFLHLFTHVLALPSLNPCVCTDHVPLGLRHGHDHVLPDSMSAQ